MQSLDLKARPEVDAESSASTLDEDFGNPVVEHCFQVLKEELVDGPWTLVDQVNGVNGSYLEVPHDDMQTCWIRLSLEKLGFPYHDKIWTCLPEVWAVYDLFPGVHHKIIHLNSPGDVIMRAGWAGGRIRDSHARAVSRTEFPKPGMTTLLTAPKKRGELCLFHLGLVHYHVATAEEIPGGYEIAHYVKLARKDLLNMMRPAMQCVANLEAMNFSPGHQIYQEVRQFYVVLSLRNGVNGPPLLPVHPDAHHEGPCANAGGLCWASVPHWKDNFSFTTYMTKCFEALGESIPVWDCFAGRFLVPYQAVVAGSDWRRVAKEFQSFFQSQRTAYRKLHKDPSPPRVKETKEPRFTDRCTTQVPDGDSASSVILEQSEFEPVLKVHHEFQVLGAAEYV